MEELGGLHCTVTQQAHLSYKRDARWSLSDHPKNNPGPEGPERLLLLAESLVLLQGVTEMFGMALRLAGDLLDPQPLVHGLFSELLLEVLLELQVFVLVPLGLVFGSLLDVAIEHADARADSIERTIQGVGRNDDSLKDSRSRDACSSHGSLQLRCMIAPHGAQHQCRRVYECTECTRGGSVGECTHTPKTYP